MKKETRKADIVFVLPKTAGLFTLKYTIGIAYMQAYLKSIGITSVIMPEHPVDIRTLVGKVLEFNPKIIGFTTYDPVFYLVKMFAKAFKEINQKVLLVAGGPTATFSDSLFLGDPNGIDVCVRGEGEYVITDLLRYMLGEKELYDIEGVSYTEGGKLVRTPLPPLIGNNRPKGEELDILPSPHQTGILSGLEWAGGIQTSRGCVFRCNYCNGPNMFGFKVRYHSLDRVIHDLKYIEERLGKKREKIRNDIWDDNFCLDTKRTRELLERIIREKIRLFLHAELRADRMNKELLELMYEAGIRMVNFGLESGVPAILRNIKKVGGISKNLHEEKKYISAIHECVSQAKKLGMQVSISFINGLPGETLEDGQKTVEMVNKLGVDFCYHNRLTVFPGTELMETHRKFGLELKQGRDILPYEVKYTYDISKIPFLINSFVYHIHYKNQRSVSDFVFGWWGGSTGELKEVFPFIILHDISGLNNHLLKWLRNIVRINSSVFLIFEKLKPTQSMIDRLTDSLYSTLPTRYIYFLKQITGKHPGRNYYQWLISPDIQRSYVLTCDFHLVPFSHSTVYRVKIPSSGKQPPSLLFSINSKKDFQCFLNYLSNFPINPDNSKFDQIIQQGALIQDGCRWHSSICPGVQFHSLHVMPDNSLKTCINGNRIGSIVDSENAIRNNLLRLKEQKEKERGCRSCPVNGNCSKCLFPHPLTDAEFCEFRRSHPRIGNYMKMMEFFKDIELKQKTGIMKFGTYPTGILT